MHFNQLFSLQRCEYIHIVNMIERFAFEPKLSGVFGMVSIINFHLAFGLLFSIKLGICLFSYSRLIEKKVCSFVNYANF